MPQPQDQSDNDGAARADDQSADPNIVASDRVPSRPLLLGILSLLVTIAIAATLLQIFVADRIPELTPARLQAAQAVWLENGPESYNLEVEIRGAQPGEVQLEVRDGQVTAMTRDGRSPPQRTWDVWSVPGQFETLERELVLAEDPQHEMDVARGTKLQLRCEFDPKFGFPRRYHRFTTGGAPEVFWRITVFEPQ